MDDIMKQFSSFLSEGEENNEFKGALNSVVTDIISKDSMYPPMKKLRDEFPTWLETNWEKCSDEELERYNN
jgi:peroxin-19